MLDQGQKQEDRVGRGQPRATPSVPLQDQALSGELTGSVVRELKGGVRFGSPDSRDVDTLYAVNNLPSVQACKALCSNNSQESRNLIIVRDGVVADCYKGLPDETNNALFHTYRLHDQQSQNPVTQPVTRIVPLKVVRAVRVILSQLSRTEYRDPVKDALRSLNMAQRIATLAQVDFTRLTLNPDALKSIAFQLVQTIALVGAREIYTKQEAQDFAPAAADLISRRPGSLAELNQLRDQLLDALHGVYFRQKGNLNLFMYGNALAIREWNLYARQSRGVVVDMLAERCVAFPMDKFFRFGEGPELSRDRLPLDTPVEIVEKVDGSMVSLIDHGGQFEFCCKGNFDTPQSRRAAQIAARLPIGKLQTDRYFHVFEVIYPENRFPKGLSVVNYGDREDLVLTAMRDRLTNLMLPYSEVIAEAQRVGLSHPRVFNGDLGEVFRAVDTASPELHDEGYIIRLQADGRLFKLKYHGYSEVLRMVNEMRTNRFVRAHLDLQPAEREASLQLLPADIRAVAEQHLGQHQAIVLQLLGFLDSTLAGAPSGGQVLAEYIKQAVPRELQDIAFRYHRQGLDGVQSLLERAALKMSRQSQSSPEDKFWDGESLGY